MHVPTHIMSGWVIANCVPLTPRERLACMIISTAPDLDGLGILFGRDAYDRWHHVACHGLPFGLLATIVLVMIFSQGTLRRLAVAGVLLICFHAHLLMDYYGSGPGWPIVYWFPFSDFRFVNWESWDLSSWQNTLAAGVLLVWTIAIARVAKRTPLEVLMPSLDAKLVRKTRASHVTEQGR